MTIFPAHRLPKSGPRYVAIADAIETAIAAGELQPGDRLPAHRPLAFDLGVTVGTVSRAYELAARRGLVDGAVGRGTFIRGTGDGDRKARGAGGAEFTAMHEPGMIPMRANLPTPVGQDVAVAHALDAILRDPAARTTLADYAEPGGTPRQRAALAQWMSQKGFAPDPQHVVLTAGAQQALACALAVATEPGDLVLAEALTYRVIATQCHLLGRRLKPVALDDEGLSPGALEDACRTQRPKALVTIPTLQNPTGITMSARRRKAIAGIAERNTLTVIEDDTYGKLTDAPAPLASHLPETAFYITSLSKCVAPGLRTGAVLCPPRQAARVRGAQHALGQGLPPVTSEVAARLIESGEADALTAKQREETRARNREARAMLGNYLAAPNPHGAHIWLTVPSPWRVHDFVEAARNRSLSIASDEDFALTAPPAERHVRVALGPPATRDDFRKGIGVLAALLAEGPLAAA